MKILISGATGLVGTALVDKLGRQGHTVCRLIRPGGKKVEGAEKGFDVAWNPETGELGGAGVGPDVVVNLAGAPIAEARWTQERKALLVSSRADGTRALVNALAKMNARPRVFISATAIGIYGNRGDEILTEESQPGDDFLAEVAKKWEAEASKAEALGIRVVLARFGIILAREGGALPAMMGSFRLGLGARIGKGKQWMSWVSLEDVVAILCFAMENNSVRGAVNVVSPQPAQNAAFTKALATALHRPAFLVVPPFVLRLILGEMAEGMLLAGQRVLPSRLEKAGYRFLHPDLSAALQSILA